MQLQELRKEIDRIDDGIVSLFAERMDIVKQIAGEKAAAGSGVADPTREREVLTRACAQVPPELSRYTRILMNTLLNAARSYQRGLLYTGEDDLSKKIGSAISSPPESFPESALVACQGAEGAYSQLACDKLFPAANIMYFKSFEGVFTAVEKGLCEYGILPIENSSYGAVNEVYDRMRRHNFHIVRGVKLQISHALLARRGAAMAEIKEVFSHEQALGQCSRFLAANPDIKVTVCENTAIAARLVAESGRRDVASISSPECAQLYDLDMLDGNVRDESGNYTRFICIKKDLAIYPGANRISLMLTTEHKPGALYSVMEKFAALGVNISKLISRPIPGRDFEFMFYFDLDVSIYSRELLAALSDIAGGAEMFVFFGAYCEV